MIKTLLLAALFTTVAYSQPQISLDALATHALKEAFNAPNGDHWEYGGIIVSRDGYIMYPMEAITSKAIDYVLVDPSKLMQPGDKIVGLYHTHPCAPDTHYPMYISRQDLLLPYFYKAPVYVLDECSGLVHKFEFGVDHIYDKGGAWVEEQLRNCKIRRVYLPSGRIVGNIHQKGINLDKGIVKTSDEGTCIPK